MKPRLHTFLSHGCSIRGAQMGRSNDLPADREAPIKLRLEKLKWVDGDYDVAGAYWGNTGEDFVYFARCDTEHKDEKGVFYPEVFVRAWDREEAKEAVRLILPNAKFY